MFDILFFSSICNPTSPLDGNPPGASSPIPALVGPRALRERASERDGVHAVRQHAGNTSGSRSARRTGRLPRPLPCADGGGDQERGGAVESADGVLR